MKKDLSLREELELKMRGKMPLERLNPQKGESRWYYIDPRGRDDDFVSDTKVRTIDVDCPDTPNPYLQEIMLEEAKDNPQNYYIWRTEGDDLVREEHAQRDGEIFAWDEPPSGGHPGEDYNCRCTAEEFSLERYRFINYPQELLKQVTKNLMDEEGSEEYIYLDTKGIKTTGVGKNIDNKDRFMEINWQVGDRPATYKEKETAFNIFENLQKTGFFGQRLGAEKFRKFSNLQISKKEIENLMVSHLHNDLLTLEKEFPDFKTFPFQLQEVLMDIKYNTGNINQNKWPKLYKAIANKDINKIAENVSRKDVGFKRNEWAKNKILSIRGW